MGSATGGQAFPGGASALPGEGKVAAVNPGYPGEGEGTSWDGPANRASDATPPGGIGSTGSPSRSTKTSG